MCGVLQEQRSYLVARGLSPLRESPPPGEDAGWASVMAAGGGGDAAGGVQHSQRSSSVNASALRGRLQTLRVRPITTKQLQSCVQAAAPVQPEYCVTCTARKQGGRYRQRDHRRNMLAS